MSDAEDNSDEKQFVVDRAKQGRAACKKCKDKCPVGQLRIAKLTISPFGAGKMKNWYHLDCIFEQFLKQRVTTSRIKSIDDLDGLTDLNDEDVATITERINESEKLISEKYGVKTSPTKPTKSPNKPTKKNTEKRRSSSSSSTSLKLDISNDTVNVDTEVHSDRSFKEFQNLVASISSVSSYTDKTSLVKNLFTKGSNGKGFKGNVTQWCRLLLPADCKRIYNLQSKQLIKLFARIFGTDHTVMMDHLKQGDIGETIQHFFEESNKCTPASKSILTIQEVDDFLENLSQMTKSDEQMNHFKMIVSKCTSEDIKVLIRLIKHDLRMNAGAKHILQAVHPDAYQVYQASKDLNSVIKRCWDKGKNPLESTTARVKASITIMTPIQPMLAEACKSIEQAMKKCPNGMYAEIKYDGERVQLHKSGADFKYFSRSLKPVLSHKVSHFKDFIPKAFPYANDLILDSEILMIDTVTGKPLPFGTLGVHKKSEFKDANVCLFVFDCIYYNGESLVSQPIDYRKKILKENMIEIPNRIVFSELEVIHKPKHLSKMITKVLEMGLEGLVLKDLKSIYEPGKRHWLKVKKDYLHDGAMADTADLIVLGAWYGTGKKAGMMSVFLMGCYDKRLQKFCTVTKVHTGHDDKTLEKLQAELKMVDISSDPTKVPLWLKCTKTMIPDFVADDPKQQPVWEITGAEFTQHDVHTADGISIRFPRVTKIRSDKSWEEATTLKELQKLYQRSKEATDIKLLMDVDNDTNHTSTTELPKKKSPKTISGTKRKREKSFTKEPTSKVTNTVTKRAKHDEIDTIKEPLPNIFEDVRLLVEEGGEKQFDKWIRYFIAYGGTLVNSETWEEATHVLHLEDSVAEQTIKSPRNARHVILEWIKHTVAKGSLEDFRPYSVRLEPNQNYKQKIKV
ncbi:hypothetical protein RN001_005998 [Aquatica leii]|uniref:DNA ligase n=1 Tax=Aquatica leii TaxID=1421715 RepID=A0AAN7Q152_9COLE|nr:hypothetical protein RN001_005998 [Aquatica leii]